MAFVQIWSWYQKEYGQIVEDTIMIGKPLNIVNLEMNCQSLLRTVLHQVRFGLVIIISIQDYVFQQNLMVEPCILVTKTQKKAIQYWNLQDKNYGKRYNSRYR